VHKEIARKDGKEIKAIYRDIKTILATELIKTTRDCKDEDIVCASLPKT
jgi:predicted transcriptional regulator